MNKGSKAIERFIITRTAVAVNCPVCKTGAMASVPLSRLEAGLGHEGYRCDNPKCGHGIKYVPPKDGVR